MLHKKSPAPIGNETPRQNHYTRMANSVKRIHRRVPPHGKFYSDILQGKTVWQEDLYCLVYIGTGEAYQMAKIAHEIGLPHPIVLPPNVNPKIYRWPVVGLDVRVLEWEPLIPESLSMLTFELISTNAVSVYIKHWTGELPIKNVSRGICYE